MKARIIKIREHISSDIALATSRTPGLSDQKRLFQENINSLRIYSIRSTKRNQNPLKDWTVFTL